MYTVLRIEGSLNLEHEIASIGERLNAVVPNFYSGVDRRGGRSSCSVYKGFSWDEHSSAVDDTLSKTETILQDARALGLTLELDILIEREDLGGDPINTFAFPPRVLKLLSNNCIVLVMTIDSPAGFQ